MQAASYLGHKQVEQVVTKWLHCVALSMIAGNDAVSSEAPEDIKKSVGSMESSREEWQQVLSHQNSTVLLHLHVNAFRQIVTSQCNHLVM